MTRGFEVVTRLRNAGYDLRGAPGKNYQVRIVPVKGAEYDSAEKEKVQTLLKLKAVRKTALDYLSQERREAQKHESERIRRECESDAWAVKFLHRHGG